MQKSTSAAVLLSVILAITTGIFATLYFTQGSRVHKATTTLYVVDTTTGSAHSKFVDVLHAIPTEPLGGDKIAHYSQYFHTTLDASTKRIFPYGVWVDKNVVLSAINDASVDGFRIIPIMYDEPHTSGSTQYNPGDVNFAVIFTHPNTGPAPRTGGRHQEDVNLGFDYNQPCPTIPCP